jgi:aerobic-type carbon monoxide dehydrogenase small subunit (CoxS/CutS family)
VRLFFFGPCRGPAVFRSVLPNVRRAADGHTIETVEGLAADRDHLHPLQESMRDCHGLQCGYCTSGILMTMKAFLEETPAPDEAQIRDALSGNLCRCTGYQHIVDATKLAAERLWR